MIWFTGDPHYYHRNVLKHCDRPFRDLEHMHEELIRRWHERVQDGDEVYILGDFAFAGVNRSREILTRLRDDKNIKIILVRGNHDPNPARCEKIGFDEVLEGAEMLLTDTLQIAEMSHFPYPPTASETFRHRLANFWKFWRRRKYTALRYMDLRPENIGRWLFHGHVHCAWKVKRRMINVGVDVHDFYPVSLDDLKKIVGPRK